MTVSNNAEEVKAIHEISIDKNAEKMAKIKNIEDQMTTNQAELLVKDKQILSLEQKLTISNDLLKEKEIYIKNVDNMYGDIIQTKDDVINNFKRINDNDDDIAKNFKRILVKTLADKELNNVKELYKAVKCHDAQCQTEVMKNSENRSDNENKRQSPSGEEIEGAVEEEKDVNFSDMVKKTVVTPDVVESDKDKDLVSIRVSNLPPDIDEKEVAKIFGIEKSSGKVVFVNTSNTTIVKLIIPGSREKEILKLNKTILGKRRIYIFKIEKCRLGLNCKRKICRFGHEESFRIEGDCVKQKNCKYGSECFNKANGCQFFHDESICRKSGIQDRSNNMSSKTRCWFQQACRYKERCKFSHDAVQSTGETGKNDENINSDFFANDSTETPSGNSMNDQSTNTNDFFAKN